MWIQIGGADTEDGGGVSLATVRSEIAGAGHQSEAQVRALVTAYGYQTQAQVITAVASAISSSGHQSAAQVQALINAAIAGLTLMGGGATEARVNELIAAAGHQTAPQVNTLIAAAGHQTEPQVNALIAAAGHLTEAAARVLITGYGYQTSQDVTNSINTRGFRTEAEIQALISTAGADYRTETQIQSLINNSVTSLRNTLQLGAPTNLNTFAEIAASLNSDVALNATLRTLIAQRAPIDNPIFTGVVIVPDSADGNDSGRAANTRFVLANASSAEAAAHIAAGWSDNDVGQASELTAVSQNNSVVIPTRASNGYLVIWHSLTSGILTEVHIGTSSFNELNTFGDEVQISGPGGVSGQIRVSSAQRNATLLSGETLRMVFS